MSTPNEPAGNPKPIVRDREPHNYRKVGYSMIVISVSLVLIGLLVWAIGSNYHFASNIMAEQEVDAMTPKQGYNIVSFDYTQPIGAKLRLLDHADSIDAAKKLQDQYKQSVGGAQILIFGISRDDNVDVMARAEVAALTPTQGYNVILFNHALPVGAKLTMSKHDNLLANATAYKQLQEEKNTDTDVTVLIFSSSFDDNLKSVGVSGSEPASVAFTPDHQQTAKVVSTFVPNTQNATSPNSTSAGVNQTKQTPPSAGTGGNTTQVAANASITTGISKTVALGEKVGINSSNPGK